MKVVRKKKISKLFRSKIWPFTVKSITIYNMAGASVYCEIEGKNYALNGFAEDNIPLPSVLDSEYYIKEKEITPIIDIGLSLFSQKEIDKLKSISRGIKIIKG